MSHNSILIVEEANIPGDVPTSFVTQSGTAVPLANVLDIIGAGGIVTSASGNTVTITGGAAIAETYTANTGTATPALNNLNIFGTYVAAGSTPVATVASGSTVTVDVQTSQAIASTNASNIGLAAFNSADFTVDVNGFVSLSGTGGAPIQTITGDTGGAETPLAGNFNIKGTANQVLVTGSAHTETISLIGPYTPATYTAHSVLIGEGTSSIVGVGPTATAGQILQSQGSSSDPAFSTATYPSTTTINQILYSSSANTVSGLSTSDNGVLITGTTGTPSILAAGTTGQVLTATTGSPPSWESPAASSVTFTGDSGTPFTGNAVTVTGGTTGLTFAASSPDLTLGGILRLANGGTSADLTASNGGIFYSTATAGAILSGTATADQVLLSGSSSAPAWSTATYPATTTINQLLYSSSNNVITGLSTANDGVLTTGTTGIPVITSLSSDGQLIIGSSAGAPAAATLTAGTGISITNGHNSISIAVNGAVVGETITGNSGGALSPTAGNWNIVGTGSITTVGSVSTLTIELTGLTQYNVLLGQGSTTVGLAAPGTAGIPLVSNGATSYPSFSTALVVGGGTGSTSFNTDGVVVSGTTSTSALTALSLTDGQIVIGSSAGVPLAENITAGTGISVTNGHNSITIAVNNSVVGETITGQSGGALSPTAGNWNIYGNGVSGSGTSSAGNIITSGSGSTLTINSTEAQFMTNYTSVAHSASPYTVLATDYYISCVSSGGTITIKLPNAPTTNRLFIIKDQSGDASTSNISVTTAGGSVTIDGQTTYTLVSNYSAINLLFNGTSYEVY